MNKIIVLAAALFFATAAMATPIDINVDKKTQTMLVEVNNTPFYRWPVSTGLTKCKKKVKGVYTPGNCETPTGTYSVKWMDADHHSDVYENAPMPHSIFFRGGYAIHGTIYPQHLGRKASHGCVRLSRTNAKALFDLVKNNKAETTITIKD